VILFLENAMGKLIGGREGETTCIMEEGETT
jgi:hypothetical protein